jgi:large subunit ribosomal protein L24
MSKWIRRGDRVLVLAGNDKGKSGEVLSRSEDRIIVQGINIRKKHMKKTQETQGGRIIEMEVPLHISNVCICNKDNEPLKLKMKIDKEKGRVLVYKKDRKQETYRPMKKPA